MNILIEIDKFLDIYTNITLLQIYRFQKPTNIYYDADLDAIITQNSGTPGISYHPIKELVWKITGKNPNNSWCFDFDTYL